jgi:hypothetical protein
MKMSLNPKVQAISDIAYAEFSINKKEKAVENKKDIFVEAMATTANDEVVITTKVNDAVNDFHNNFVAGCGHAFGRKSVEYMTEDKKIDRLSIEVNMGGKNNVSYAIDRSKTTTDHLHGKGEITKYGVMTTALEVVAGKNGGQLKAVRKEIGELALAHFAK